MVQALLLRRTRPVERYTIDAVLAVVVTLLCLSGALATPENGNPVEPVWLSVLVSAAVGLPVSVRRRWPRAVAVAVSVAGAAALATGIIPSFATLAPSCSVILTLYTLGTAVPKQQSWPIAAASVTPIVGALIAGDVLWPASELGGGQWLWSTGASVVYAMFVIGPAYGVGYVIRVAREQNEWVAQQAIRQAATDERLRVARELHDVIAHTMTLIVVKASVANHVADVNPAEARDALRAIEQTGRSAMAEVRRVLDVLREDGPGGGTHGLDDLAGLAERAAMGGVDVHLDVRRHGGAENVPDDVGLAVYRIVQEAVTNVVKHAAPTVCRASVVVLPAEVRVEVVDEGTRPPVASPAGHGLIGMRERTALHGGEFRAGPRPEGGFAVTASLPYGGGR